MAISTIATTDSPETGRGYINANFQDVLSAFGGSATAFPKRYVALLTQSGTDAPVATVLENTLGETVVWTRTNEGEYNGTLASAFTVNKSVVLIGLAGGGIYNDEFAQSSFTNANIVAVQTGVVSTATLSDDLLSSTPIHITVYP